MVDTQPKEVELKLAATSEAMDTLIASQLLRGHARSSLRSRQLVTTYYDTDDHRLGRRRLALRVRQTGRQVHPDPQDRERRRGCRDRARRMGGGAAGRHAAADRLQRSGRARPDRPGPARRAAADLRDALPPPGDAGRVARRQPAAGPDRDRVRPRRHPRRRRRDADLRDRARAQARRAPGPVRACPVDAGAGAGAAAAAGQGGARLRAGHRRCRRRGARPRAVQLRGDDDGRGRAADASLAPACGTGSRTRPPPAMRAIRRGCTRSAWPCAGCARRWRLFKTALGDQARADWSASCAGCSGRWARRATSTCSRPRRSSPCARRGAGDPALAVLAELVDDARWKAHHHGARHAGVRALRRHRLRARLLGRVPRLAAGCRHRRAAGAAPQRARLRRRDPDQAPSAGAQARPQLRRARTPPPATSCGSCSRSSATAPSSSPRCSRAASSTATAPRPRGCRICSAT